jgi:hypothetical protein
VKILFICGSLEPGNDGVGDYTARLASELLRIGHKVSILAFNDKFSIHLSSGAGEVPILRMPSDWALKTRFLKAKDWINEFKPDWISLQFVIFSFNKKGLPFGLASRLSALGTHCKWHIMFHELWVQKQKKFNIKRYLWGIAQRKLINNLIKKLNPRIIHTNTSLYQKKLTELGFQAHILPLFSNIPNIAHLERLKNTALKPNGKLIFVIFGTIHPGVPVKDFVEEVSNYAIKSGIQSTLTVIGRCGNEQESWIRCWTAAGMMVNKLGEQSAINISKVLGAATFGISTTDIALIQKSGSVAAMYEHGLPVICIPCRWQFKRNPGIVVPKGTVVYQAGNVEKILGGPLNLPVPIDIKAIARQFSDCLLNNNV